jgi:tetratricopeptide (TPR) repeat protein
MNFRRYHVPAAIILLAVLLVPPVLSADTVTAENVANDSVAKFIAGENVTSVTNNTADLENDAGTKFYNYGVQSITLGDYNAAIGYFDQALQQNLTMLHKTDALLYLYQGKSYAQIRTREFAGAVTTADAGLAVYPKDAMLWNNKGWALENLGKNQEALAAYDQAVAFDANYTNALINQGNLLAQMGKYQEATAAFVRANETDPFNVAASDGIDAARKGEAGSSRNMGILMVVVVAAAIGIVVWYVKFRKPAEPEPKKKKSGKK